MRYNIGRYIFPILIALMAITSISRLQPFDVIAGLLVVMTSLPIHEFAHGYVANKLGDPTAENEGRLTLNPFAHLDLMGTLMILFVGFGWAKPVPVNPNNFKNPKAGMAITAIAGPISNLIMAFLLMLVLQFTFVAYKMTNNGTMEFIFSLVQVMVSINISLAVFNLLPIHPLDGSRILSYFLPNKISYQIESNAQIISLIFMAVIFFTDLISTPLSYVSRMIYNLLVTITQFVVPLAIAIMGG
ncbi:MAG: site-2 protease family protein [Oscillospiraceae bacterium]